MPRTTPWPSRAPAQRLGRVVPRWLRPRPCTGGPWRPPSGHNGSGLLHRNELQPRLPHGLHSVGGGGGRRHVPGAQNTAKLLDSDPISPWAWARVSATQMALGGRRSAKQQNAPHGAPNKTPDLCFSCALALMGPVRTKMGAFHRSRRAWHEMRCTAVARAPKPPTVNRQPPTVGGHPPTSRRLLAVVAGYSLIKRQVLYAMTGQGP